MNISFDTFLAEKAATGEFWLLEAGSLEWHYVLSEIGREFFPGSDENLKDFGAIVPDDAALRDPVYWARKSMLPVEVLEKRLGTDCKVLRKAKLIRLKPFSAEKVKPTVAYYGTA